MAFKTPGVQVQEIVTFPPSVVPVQTAVPAFIGYTERAENEDGTSLRFLPTRITSLLEFQRNFGFEFQPARYDVQLDVAGGNAIGTVLPRDAGGNVRRYYLYGCLRHFYANGGGPCYIVSVGSYADAPVVGDQTTPAGLQGGLSRLEGYDEPTLLLFPDGVSLSAPELGSLQAAALAQCEKLQDRFLITDLREGFLAPSPTNDPVAIFRQQVGSNNLKYGAAYYPWVQTIYRPVVRFRHLRMVDGAAATIPDATLDTLTAEPAIDALVPAVRERDDVVDSVIAAVDVSGMAGPDPLTLDRDNFARLSAHFAELLDLLRQTEPSPVGTVRQRFGNLLLLPRAIAIAFETLNDATLPEELEQAVANLTEDTELAAAIARLIALEKNDDVMSSVSTTRTVGSVESDYSSLNGTAWIAPHADVAAIAADTEDFGDTGGANQRATALSATSALQEPFDKLAAAILSLFEAAEFLAAEAEKQLFDQHPVFQGVAETVKRVMSRLPVAGGVAGVYASTDRTRGVWKAPANVSLADVIGPAVRINDETQASLNVHSTGKSVNAVRSFAGKGTLVWGARTLAGNDNEWRYVPVRRFVNMAEESIQEGTEPFVFEPNDANTWVRVRAMIENFLTIQWRQGALAGATPQRAFYVRVGLGETMTAQDILEGRMIVEVGLAVVRPAEFIILKFAHKMQVS